MASAQNPELATTAIDLQPLLDGQLLISVDATPVTTVDTAEELLTTVVKILSGIYAESESLTESEEQTEIEQEQEPTQEQVQQPKQRATIPTITKSADDVLAAMLSRERPLQTLQRKVSK